MGDCKYWSKECTGFTRGSEMSKLYCENDGICCQNRSALDYKMIGLRKPEN